MNAGKTLTALVVDDEVLATSGLKIVSNVAVGFDNIDVAVC